MSTQYGKVQTPWTTVLTSLEAEYSNLQRHGANESLPDLLNDILMVIEAKSGGTLRTCIALVDDSQKGLVVVAAPRLPQDYVTRTRHLWIEHDATPRVASAHAGKPVYIGNIETHDTHSVWAPWRRLALSHGFLACWCTPIQTQDEKLLGVFSNYYSQPCLPTQRDIEAIGVVARIAARIIEQHRTEHVLNRTAEQWRSMIDGMQEGFFLGECLRDEKGQIVDFHVLEVNPAFERQSGIRAGGTLRKMGPNVPAEIMETFIQVLETGEDTQREFFTSHPLPAWYEVRVRQEGPDRLMALFLNVTARKQAQAELWEGQQHKNFLLVLGDHLRKLDDGEAIEYAACEGLGKHMKMNCVAMLNIKGENRDTPYVSVRWPVTVSSLFDVEGTKTLDAVVRKGNSAYLSSFAAHADGKERIKLIVVPLARWGREGCALVAWPAPFDPFGGLHRLAKGVSITVIEEVAERMCAAVERCDYSRNLEQRIESAVAERDRIWRLSPELLAVMDDLGQFVSVNPAVSTILGWTQEEFLRMGFDELIHAQDLDCARDELQRIRDSDEGTSHRLESRALKRDGTYSWINWSLSRADGHLYLAGRDDTNLKVQAEVLLETEKALRQSQKIEAVGRLTGGIAHDFNNMLQGISGALFLIRRKLSRGELDQVQRFIGVAADSADRAARLTGRLLTFSRQQPIDPVPFDVGQTICSMAELFQRYTGELVELPFDVEPDLWTVCCDKNQFENVVLNLVINACDAMPNGGRLTISSSNRVLDEAFLRLNADIEPGDFVEVCVADVGCGMTPDVLAHAFDPFFTTKPQGEGTGLGLSMIYGFTKQAGGLVTLNSEVDAGTAVRVYLPRFLGPPLQEPPPVPDVAMHSPNLTGIVAVVEDDANVREMVRESLVELGLSVVMAADGDEGLKIVAGEVDLLVTDVGLPGLDGRRLASAAQRYHPGLPVLFMTGYAQGAATDPQFLGEGMALIVKPFSLDMLAQRVVAMLKEARAVPH